MGGTNRSKDTICIQGCAMSSVSMMLSGKGFQSLMDQKTNPGSLNDWLRANQGYTCIGGNCNNLVLDAPNKISPQHIHFLSEKEKPTLKILQSYIIAENPVVIAHVRNRTHFVLVTGFDSSNNQNTIYVNDPFFNVTYYLYEDIADALLYMVDQQ